MDLLNIIEKDKAYFMNVYGDRTPVCFSHGDGCCLWDIDGKKYYDFLGGIAVSSLGHCHPKLTKALKDQVDKLLHTSSLYYIESQANLAEALVQHSCSDKVFFCNSGAEANEGAIKLARKYSKKQGLENRYEIITLQNSFHGRTLTTVAATGQEKYQKPFMPLMPGFKYAPINDIQALQNAITPMTCAIMLELIQGESGVHPVDQKYMDAVKTLCDENNLLLIIDEIQTGIGRTGKLFAYEHYNIEPDIFTLAKGLGGGVPIGAVCAKDSVASAFQPGDHGTTFGGNPLVCSAGLAVIDTLVQDGLVENASSVGAYFKEQLLTLKEKHPVVKEVRGQGLMIGIELSSEISKKLSTELFQKGFLAGSVGTTTLRFLPPLVVTQKEVDILIDALDDIL
ncbi:MAG: acetylornithine transaminase [Clostridia bacterium]|nr:acetylornithine transaminase [Clostridia bacterium]